MKKEKVIKSIEFPEEFQDKIWEKIHHCGGSCHWYPGDGFFKPLEEVINIDNILFLDSDTLETKDVYVYEKGDDKIGDWIMDKYKVKLCEEILIIR